MFTANISVDVSLMLDSSGVNVYFGDKEYSTAGYSLKHLTDSFLEAHCDENGKIYTELTYELEDLLEQMRICVGMLEDAKN